MGFETERTLKILSEYVEKHQDAYASPEAALEDAIKKWNAGNLSSNELFEGKKSDEYKALEVFEKALCANSLEKRIQLLEKAYKLDPSNLDIRMAHILSKQSVHEAFETLSQVEQDFLKKHRKTLREGYVLLENRSYFRLKYSLVEYYFEQKLYRKAIEQGKESLRLNPNDNLGVRYILMAVYVLIADYQSAQNLYRSNADNRFDDQLTLCMLTVAVLVGKMNEGKKLAQRLMEINPKIISFFQEKYFNDYKVGVHLPEEDRFEVNSEESLALTFNQLLELYEVSDYLYNKVQGLLKESNPEAFERYEQQRLLPFRAKELAGHGIFTNIKEQYVYELLKGGFETEKDFKSATEKEILALPMIGKVTLQRLKKNGVRFKDSQ